MDATEIACLCFNLRWKTNDGNGWIYPNEVEKPRLKRKGRFWLNIFINKIGIVNKRYFVFVIKMKHLYQQNQEDDL